MASSSRAQSVDEALTAVIASLEKEQDLKKVSGLPRVGRLLHHRSTLLSFSRTAIGAYMQSLKEALEPVDEVIRTATAEIHRLHSAPSSSRMSLLQTLARSLLFWACSE
jgi:hypothetical protein